MWNRSKEVMYAQHLEIGIVDLNDLHEFIAQFRHLDRRRQKSYVWMIDGMTELWDAFDEVE